MHVPRHLSCLRNEVKLIQGANTPFKEELATSRASDPEIVRLFLLLLKDSRDILYLTIHRSAQGKEHKAITFTR